MFLARLTSRLARTVVPWAGFSRSCPGSGVIGSYAFRPLYSLQPASPSRAASLPGKRTQSELEEFLVPRKMAISPLESWLTAQYLLPRRNVEVPVTLAPSQFYECPPRQGEEEAQQGVREAWDATPVQCKNVLKIRRRKTTPVSPNPSGHEDQEKPMGHGREHLSPPQWQPTSWILMFVESAGFQES